MSYSRAGHERLGNQQLIIPVKAATEILQGTMVAIGTDGYAVPAAQQEGLKVAGAAAEHVDNRSGADGEQEVSVKRGVFLWKKDQTIAKTDILKNCYVSSADTVTLTAEGSSVAGVILGLEEDYAIVDMMAR